MSSAIGFVYLSQGPTGPAGNEGPRGPIGPTGVTTDQIGPRGANAPNIQDISFVEGKATVTLSNGTTFQATGFFGGATATDTATVHVVDYLNSASDSQTYSFLSSGDNTGSFIIRGITGGGSIVISEDNEAIYIDSIYGISAGNTDSAGLVDNTLVYLKTNNQISSTTIGVTSGGFFHGTLDFIRPGPTLNLSKILPRAKVKYIPPTYKTDDALPVTLNVGDAGLFYIRTPNGISGFSGDFKNSEIVSFTLIVESDDIWNFPDNVFFTSGENYLTCGKSIVNLTTFDQGTSWYAVVAARGLDINPATCSTRSLVGSCCFDGITGTSCKDFITKNECDVLSGSFHPLESCQTTCGATFGVCCSNGQCLENTSYAECTAFGGTYLFGVTCGSFGASLDPTATNEFRLCFDRCQTQKVACCKDGKCLGDEFTKKQCENIIGGVAFVGKACSEVDCCIQNVKVGACCAGDGTCSQKTLTACKAANGTFLGEGELCGTVNCNCYADEIIHVGRCCSCDPVTGFNCVYSTQAQCSNGVWTQMDGVVMGQPCSPAHLSYCVTDFTNANRLCNVQTFRCCKCGADGRVGCRMKTVADCASTGGILKTTGTCTDPDDPFAGGCDCGDVNSTCTSCQHQAIPGVKCSCQTVNGVPTKTCANIPDITVDAECLNAASGVACHANANCNDTTSPCTMDSVWVNCTTTQSCQSPAVPESVDCPGTENITDSTCSTCFPDGIPANAEITFLASSLSSSQEMFIDGNLVTSDPTCLNARANTMHGFLAKDYFIPIKDDFICANGKDIQFCINIVNDIGSFNADGFVNSFRMYILRTMYPRYFSTNFAAMKGYTFASGDTNAGQSVSFIDEDSDSVKSTNPIGQITYKTERSVWGRLHGFRNLAANKSIAGKQIQLLNSLKYANNLSSFLTTDGFDFINFNDILEGTESDTININTRMMIDELNCPLFGYNPRGRFLGHEGTLTTGQVPLNPQSLPLGITYPLANAQGNTFYFQSVNIGGRFGLQQSTMTGNGVLSLLAQDKANPDRIDNQPYTAQGGGTARSKSGFISKSIRSNSNTGLKNRSFGYTDLGYGKFCGSTFKTHQTLAIDADGVLSIGNYTMEASTSRFANVFLNTRLYAATSDNSNSSTADTIIPYGYGYGGHPLFIDYMAEFSTITSGFPSQTNDTIEFNADFTTYSVSSASDNTCGFISDTDSDGNIKTTRSPIYKTRPTTIICDTGVIDFFGNKIEDYNQPKETNEVAGSNRNAPRTFAHKRQYIGAINNPFYASSTQSASHPNGAEPAISIISKTDAGIKICVKLKEYQNYVLTDAQINKGTFADSDYSTYLKEPSAADNSIIPLQYGNERGRGLRITRAKNTLRLVIFNNPYNPYSAGISFGADNDFSDLRNASDKYINHLMTSSGNGVTFQFGCTGSSCNCKITNTDSANTGKCNSCTITEQDKITNGYGVAHAEDFICAISGGPKIHADPCGSCIRTIRRGYPLGYGTSLGSLYTCSCRTQGSLGSRGFDGSMSLSASFNCRNCNHTNTSPCSCKTTTLRENYTTEDIPACSPPGGTETCPDCIDCTNPIDPPGFGQISRCISSCSASNEKMGCTTEEPIGTTLGGKNKAKVTRFFDQFGYVEGTDYWINSTGSNPMIVWKLFPIFINGKENYYFPMVAPSIYMVLPVSGSNPPSFLREAICAPVATTPALPVANCGLNNATLLTGIVCFNHCEIPGESCKLHVINDLLAPPLETMTFEFLANELAHSGHTGLDPGSPLANKLDAIGNPCPTGGHYPDNNASNFTSTYKKFFFTEDQFICVNVDCSSIDCTLLQDCVP